MYHKHGKAERSSEFLTISSISHHEVSDKREGRSWLVVRYGMPSVKDVMVG